jgi:hypothetical protein
VIQARQTAQQHEKIDSGKAKRCKFQKQQEELEASKATSALHSPDQIAVIRQISSIVEELVWTMERAGHSINHSTSE